MPARGSPARSATAAPNCACWTIATSTGRFDRIVSIEMIEAVGERYWPAYFAQAARLPCQRRRSACSRPSPSTRSALPHTASTPDFIQRYIFPGGMLPTRSIIEREAARAGLKLVHHELFGDSYVATLREWRIRFLQAWPSIETLGFDSDSAACGNIISPTARSGSSSAPSTSASSSSPDNTSVPSASLLN